MKKILPLLLLILIGCSSESNNNSNSQKNTPQVSKDEPKEIIKQDSNNVIKELREEYVITDYDSRLLPSPDSNNQILRIPKDTRLKVIESQDVQQGMMLNKWYKVEYNGKTGWTSSFNMKTQPEVRITTREQMLSNYEKKIGSKPVQNQLNGKILEVVNWLKKNKNNYDSIKFTQWYEPYPQNNKWVCRVQFNESLNGISLSSDLLFYISNGKVIEVVDKNY